MISKHSHRKDEHVSLAEKFYRDDVDSFDDLRFVNAGLPSVSLDEINLATHIGPVELPTPFYLEAISGGSEYTKKINATLAAIAAQTGIAMAVGSQSVALSDPSLRDTFKIVRQVNPDGPIFANIGANRSAADALAAVEMISADALEVHINTAQELIMPEGDREFHFTENIAEINAKVQVPVIVKEVGFGISQETIHQLINMGVKYINVSGRGGTDFAKIENFRRHSKDMAYLENWGLTTTESLLESRQFQNQATMIASGGIKSPLDVAKCLALGSSAVGVAGYFLNQVIKHDKQAVIETINNWKYGLKAIMLMQNCHTISELKNKKMILSPQLMLYMQQRHLSY